MSGKHLGLLPSLRRKVSFIGYRKQKEARPNTGKIDRGVNRSPYRRQSRRLIVQELWGVAQPKFNGELGITLSDLKKIRVQPVYVCSSLLVCMDCGFAELKVPVTEL